MKNIIIFGATSCIAEHVCRLYAKEKCQFFLFARNTETLSEIEDDLLIRGASNVFTECFDAEDFNSHSVLVHKAFTSLSKVDIVLLAHGSLPSQESCQNSSEETIKEININGVSVISLLTNISNHMEKQKCGTIAAITSVAGDRGRQSNYIYGSAKSLVSTYMQGLAQRLHKSNVQVVDIKPGFVDTPMTNSFKKGALWSSPEKVAIIIKNRLDKGRPFSYVPNYWYFIMSIIKLLPSFIFNRLKL